MEPNREYLTTSTLCAHRANIAIISSVAFPHVAFRSPPTAHNIVMKEISLINNARVNFLPIVSEPFVLTKRERLIKGDNMWFGNF